MLFLVLYVLWVCGMFNFISVNKNATETHTLSSFHIALSIVCALETDSPAISFKNSETVNTILARSAIEGEKGGKEERRKQQKLIVQPLAHKSKVILNCSHFGLHFFYNVVAPVALKKSGYVPETPF
jgi:hypothetical protein